MGQYYRLVMPEANKHGELGYSVFKPTRNKLLEIAYYTQTTDPALIDKCLFTLRKILMDANKDGGIRLALVGDYAPDREEEWERVLERMPQASMAWNIKEKEFPEDKGREQLPRPRYFINHTTGEYINLLEAEERSAIKFHGMKGKWTIDTVLLMIAVGNGQGGGDYFPEKEEDSELVGSWAGHRLSASNELPLGFKEIKVLWREDRLGFGVHRETDFRAHILNGEVRLLNSMDEVVETYTAESPNLPSELKKYGLEKGAEKLVKRLNDTLQGEEAEKKLTKEWTPKNTRTR